MQTSNETNTPQDWEELIAWKPELPRLIAKWFRIIARLVINSRPAEDDTVGLLIGPFLGASAADLNDLMTLTHKDSHHGAMKILRSIFERTVTLKYITQNPNEAERFLGYDAVDWHQVLTGIHAITGMAVDEPARTNIENAVKKARKDYKQEECPTCHKPKHMGWSSLNSKDMATRVGLGHMYLHAFLTPSKLIHPTYWGLREYVGSNSPMLNTMNCVHELIVQLILIHRRHYAKQASITPMMIAAIRDYLSIWVFSQTSFDGLMARGEVREDGQRIYY